jgi:hypothetical protein
MMAALIGEVGTCHGYATAGEHRAAQLALIAEPHLDTLEMFRAFLVPCDMWSIFWSNKPAFLARHRTRTLRGR